MARSRSLALALTTFAVGLAVGWFLAPRDAPLAEPRDVRDAPGTSSSPTLRAAASNASTAPTESRRVDAPSGDTVGSATSPEPVDAAFPTLDVKVLDAEGEPVLRAEVYALPAGAPGTDEEHGVVLAQTDEEGVARLSFPIDGPYDVGALDGVRQVLATDVVLPATTPLVLRLPRTAAVKVEVDPEVLTLAGELYKKRADPLALSFVAEDRRRDVLYPGRSDAPLRTTKWVARAPASIHLLPGVRYRISGDPHRDGALLHVEPSELVPPGEVRVSLRRPVAARITVTPALIPGAPVRFAVDFLAGDRPVHQWQPTFGTEAPIGGGFVTFGVPPGAQEIRWSGPGVEDGRAPIRTEADGKAVVDVTVDVVGALPLAPPEESSRTVEVVGPRDVVRVEVLQAEPDGEIYEVGSEWDRENGRTVVEDVEGTEPVVAYGSATQDGELTYVSGATTGAERLTLVHGGHAVVVPTFESPRSAPIRIARVDGTPFRARRESNDASFSPLPIPVRAGTVVGPLEPGTIRFRVFLAGVEVGEASVEIRPGEHSPLVLRRTRETRKR